MLGALGVFDLGEGVRAKGGWSIGCVNWVLSRKSGICCCGRRIHSTIGMIPITHLLRGFLLMYTPALSPLYLTIQPSSKSYKPAQLPLHKLTRAGTVEQARPFLHLLNQPGVCFLLFHLLLRLLLFLLFFIYFSLIFYFFSYKPAFNCSKQDPVIFIFIFLDACVQDYEVDFISLSYTRTVEDVREAREFLDAVGLSATKIFAKLESRQVSEG